jgi:ATP-dependent Lon protease
MYLISKLEAIRKELGESDEAEDTEIGDIGKRLKEMELPEEHKKVANREMTRLKRMNPNMSEHQLVRSYLEWIIDLPWSKSSTDRLDIATARKVLNDDHHGLEKIKTRIIEYLSIKKLKKDMRGPILCFLGPPGGKSLQLIFSWKDIFREKYCQCSWSQVLSNIIRWCER